jgi:hypothetical protein
MREIATFIRQSKERRKARLKRSAYATLAGGLMVGVPAAILGAVLWAAFSIITSMMLGLVAVAVGFLVGSGVRSGGRGTTADFGVLGGVLTLAACALGQMLGQVIVNANVHGMNYLTELLASSPSGVFSQVWQNFTFLTAMIYVAGICTGSYRSIN